MTARVSIGTAWSEAAAFARREKALLAPLVLALMVVPVTVSQLVQPNNPFAGPGEFNIWMVIAVVALLIGVGGQMAVSRLAMGWNGSLGEAIRLALARLPTTVAAMILYFLCVGLVLFPIIVVLTLAGGATAVSQTAGVVPILTVFAAVPRILLAPALAMDRRLGPWALVKAAWHESRGQYWRLLGFFLLFFVASIVLAVAASSVIGSIATLALGKPEPMSVSRLAIALAAGVIQGVVGTIFAAMTGRIVAQLPEGPTKGI